jgi:hypothetical protein
MKSLIYSTALVAIAAAIAFLASVMNQGKTKDYKTAGYWAAGGAGTMLITVIALYYFSKK